MRGPAGALAAEDPGLLPLLPGAGARPASAGALVRRERASACPNPWEAVGENRTSIWRRIFVIFPCWFLKGNLSLLDIFLFIIILPGDLSKWRPMVLFWGRCTTHVRIYLSGDWDFFSGGTGVREFGHHMLDNPLWMRQIIPKMKKWFHHNLNRTTSRCLFGGKVSVGAQLCCPLPNDGHGCTARFARAPLSLNQSLVAAFANPSVFLSRLLLPKKPRLFRTRICFGKCHAETALTEAYSQQS